MNLIEKIKAIEIYVCENFEELGLDDPVEEEYGVSLPEDWKKLYRYKNGSGFSAYCPAYWERGSMHFLSCL